MMKPVIDKVVGGVLLAGFLAGMVGYGGGKTNSVPPNLNAPFAPMGEVHPLQGLARLIWPEAFEPRILSHPLQMADAEKMAANWNVRGAWRDSFKLDFDEGWVCPWGTNHLTSVEVLSHGEIRPQWNDTNAVARLGVPVSIVPGLTNFSFELTPSNSYRFAWTDAVIGRAPRNTQPNNLMTASIELMRCGDVAVTTNGVTWTIPRELPFAHDGYGQDDEWVVANFTNATEIAAAGGYAAWVDAQVGEGLTNGLYKLTVALTNTPPEVVNLTVGDWSVAMTNVGECVFLLEKGTRYEIGLSYYMDGFSYACDDGEEVAAPRLLRGPVNSPAYSVLLTASDDTGSVELVEPSPSGDGYVIYYPWLSLSPDHEVDPTFPLLLSVSVFDLPQGAYPTVEWQTNNLTIATGENFFWYGDEDVDAIDVVATCRDATLHGHYSIERHVRSSEITLSGGGLIIVEDAYTNAPGEVVSASSTSVGVDLAWSLAEDGTLTLDADCAGAVECTNECGATFPLPYSWYGYADEEDGLRLCVAGLGIGTNGTLSFSFTPDTGGATLMRTVGVDVVKIRVEAEADWPSNKVRHVFGPKERFAITSTPQVALSVEPGSLARVTGNTVTAPDRATPFSVTVSTSGHSRSASFHCIAPTALRGGNPRLPQGAEFGNNGIYDYPAGYAAVVMHIDTWLEPSYVSFEHLRLYEGFANPSNRQGWYLDTDEFPDSAIRHDETNGASQDPATDFISITSGNNTHNGDFAGAMIGYSDEFCDGAFQLAIPLKWYAIEGGATNSLPTNLQSVWVYTNGTMRVQKNGVTWERTIDGASYQITN